MKLAYLIMAHHRPDLLTELLNALDDERNDIFVHIDLKSRNLEWKLYVQKADLHIIPSMSVNWGGYSQIECEYRLLKAALQEGRHGYYHLLTGATYPIKSQDYINNYLEKHYGTEYVGYDEKRDYSFRVKYKHLFCEVGKISGLEGKIKYKLRNYYIRFQKIIGVNYFKKYGMTCKKGCAYWSITQEFAQYVVSCESLIKKILAYSISGDEIFMQMLLYNSCFKDNARNLTDEYDGCMREVAWEHITKCQDSGHNFNFTDLDYLLNSDKWFALKFEGADGMELIAELKRKLEL